MEEMKKKLKENEEKLQRKKDDYEYLKKKFDEIKAENNDLRKKLKTAKEATKEVSADDVALLYGQINISDRKGQSSKLKPVWSGPHLIVRALTPYTFKIRIQNREEKVVNHDSIKLCTDRKTSLPNWIVKEQKVITEGQQSLHCICNQPDDGETMIQCSSCYVWFHCECIHLTENQARRTKTFICPICML